MNTTPTALSKTTAIAKASKSVSIHGRGTNWTIYGPYRASEPAGPYTQASASGYDEAVRRRAAWAADVALALMGVDYDQSHDALNGYSDFRGSVAHRVDAVLTGARY